MSSSSSSSSSLGSAVAPLLFFGVTTYLDLKNAGSCKIEIKSKETVERERLLEEETRKRHLARKPIRYPWNWVAGTCILSYLGIALFTPRTDQNNNYKYPHLGYLSVACLGAGLGLLTSTVETQQPPPPSS